MKMQKNKENRKKNSLIEAHRKTFLIGVKVMFIFLLLVIPTISATTWTSSLSYEDNDMTAVIKNWWGLGAEQGKLTLASHESVDQVKQVGLGKQVVMYYDFDFNELIENGLGEIEFINMKTGRNVERDYKYVYWFEEMRTRDICLEYEEIDNNTIEDDFIPKCIKEGKEDYLFTEWKDYDTKDIPKGNIRIGIEVNNKYGDWVDGIWSIGSKSITKHAIWNATLENDLDSWWKLDEISGTNATDSWGVNHGTANNTRVFTTNVTGIINTGADFTGGDDDIYMGTFEEDIKGVSFWVYGAIETGVDEVVLSFSSTYQHNICIGRVSGSTTDETLGIRRQTGSAGYPTTYIKDTFSEGWHHIVITWDNSITDYKIYVDGVSRTTYTGTHGSPSLITSEILGIGKDYSIPEGAYLDKLLDEVGIWSRELTSEEVTLLYNSGDGMNMNTFDLEVDLISPTDNLITNEDVIDFVGDIINNTVEILNVSLIINETIEQTNSTGAEGEYTFTETLSDGVYEWEIMVYDDNDVQYNSTTRTITIDTISPTIVIDSNPTIMNLSVNHTINFTATDDNLDKCWYNYNGSNIIRLSSSHNNNVNDGDWDTDQYMNYVHYVNYTTVPIGTEWKFRVNDVNYTETIPSVCANKEVTQLRIRNLFHGGISYSNYFECYDGSSWEEVKEFNDNVFIDLNEELIEGTKETPDVIECSSGIEESFNFTADSSSLIGVIYANDTAGSIESEPFTLTLDPTPPEINITYGSGNFNYGALAQNHTINFTITDDNLDVVLFEYNGTNITLSNVTTGTNESINFTLVKDLYTATIYANDSTGNVESEVINWSYKIFENERTYNNSSLVTSLEEFSLNITTDGTQTPIIYLVYNGNDYLTTLSGGLYKKNVSMTNAGNHTFYWRIDYGTATILTYNSTQEVADVSSMEIVNGSCGAGLTKVMNFTFFNEINLTSIENVSVKYNFQYGISNSTGANYYGRIDDVTLFFEKILCI